MKSHTNSLRDTIAINVLCVLLKESKHLDFEQITELSYQISDKMLIARNNQQNLFNNLGSTLNGNNIRKK